MASEPPGPTPLSTLTASFLSPAADAEGFTPGAVLAARYRIVGLLGRGGMGEVYRADDLRLGQPVALKFLTRALDGDRRRLDRFVAEVRMARQVSHPNVCRVHDIADIEGRHCLSMEYIDGEDLRSLLQRIGRLPPDKALEIARQICAGLAAAHEHGVLHRDLKPANVMLDGRGRARITDFGLSVAAGSATDGEIAGTPVYMAPEQLAGRAATVQSDIYALGLVLYEVYTGKRAFDETSLHRLLAQKEEGEPPAPSEFVRDIDPDVERLILRCLARDPRARPASAAQVIAALPGGSALDAALRAGETPLPDVVAAAGARDGLEPARAWTLLACAAAGAVLAVWLAPHVMLLRRAALRTAPDVLIERARTIYAAIGHDAAPEHRASAFEVDVDHLRHLRLHDTSRRRWTTAEPSFARFWVRDSPRPLESWRFPYRYGNRSRVGPTDPPLDLAGMSLLRFEPGGRLIQLVVVPPVDAAPLPRAPDWNALVAAAGFDPAEWRPSPPRLTPAVYADARAAWEGTWPGTAVPVRLEAAAVDGRPVFFEAVFPWTPPPRTDPGILTGAERAALVPIFLAAIVMVVSAAVMASRNLRAGRGDRRGAWRLSAFVFLALVVSWFFGERHVATIGEVTLVVMALAWAVLVAGACWLGYVAAEPFLRRRWPRMLVSWMRVLAGDVRDPLVGRDVLIGCVGGTVIALLSLVGPVAPVLFGRPPDLVPADVLGVAYDPRTTASLLVWRAPQAVIAAMSLAFGLLLLRLVLPSQRAAMAAFVLISGGLLALPYDAVAITFAITVVFSAVDVALLRVGLLPTAIAIYTSGLFLMFPMTTDLDAWYAGAGVSAMLVFAALTIFGFVTSLGGHSPFGRAAAAR